MKKSVLFLVISALFALQPKSGISEDISLYQTFSADTSFNPFPPAEVIYGLKISGKLEMHSLTSLVRVLVITDKGEYMVLEIYPLISADSSLDFKDFCDETCFLDGVIPSLIRLEIIDASISIDYLSYEKEYVENASLLQYQEKREKDNEKIEIMNRRIPEFNMNWNAGNTSLVEYYYRDKKEIYHEKYNLLGYDYYKGGIYELIGYTYPPITFDSLVHQWDWRNRHGANDPNSPYFDGDDSLYTGWLTIPKNQGGCGACVAFGSLGALESLVDLYYNQYFDLDLSEQQLLSCVPGASCLAIPIDNALNYIEEYGVVNENCSPYLENDDSLCSDVVCQDPDTIVKISSWSAFQGSYTSHWEDIFGEMVLNGPMGLTIPSGTGTHYVTLVGWNYHEENQELYVIYKDSQGPDFGIKGFVIQQVSGNYRDATSQHSPYFETIPNQPVVQVKDADRDGYDFWGIGLKPAGCDTCSDLPDCDDSNPNIGPYLSDFSCICLDTFALYDTLKITSDTVWSGIIKVENPIMVEDGGKLTITGTVFVPRWGEFWVKSGGQMIIDGGKITKACDRLWKGIQVWGDSSLSQYPTSNQGYLNIKNNGCIEYAKTAIFVGKAKYADTLYAYSGGIIAAENARFLNNEIDVEFLPFINDNPYNIGELDNFSGFRKCIFETYDPEFVLPKPIAHVILDGVKGVDFDACSFRTQEIIGFPMEKDDLGTGILVYDSQIWIKGRCITPTIPCINFDSCHFINLRYGIRAFNLGGNKSFHVSESVFNNNIAGIYLSGYHQSEINSSSFYTNLGDISGLTEDFYGGLYLDGSTGYHIENNHFDGPPGNLGGVTSVSTIGIYVRDSGEEDNEIYNNLFTELDAGIVAEGINKGERTGLCLKCNDFRQCMNDMLVFSDPWNRESKYVGIKENQGADTTLSSALAGNTFTSEIQGWEAHNWGGNYLYYWSYYNAADHFNYYHHIRQSNPYTFPTDTNYSRERIDLFQKYVVYDKDIACPSGLNNNHYKSMSDPWLEIAEADAHLFTYQNMYNSLLDGGNTEELDYDIISSLPDEALELRQQLLGDSPYLSDTVMKQAIYKENVLPNAMIRDVLIANPQSAKSDEILNAVENRFDPMPDYMMAEIMQGKNQIGALESLESKLGYWEQYRSRAVNRLIREYMTDSMIVDREDSLINLFQNESGLRSKYRLAFAYSENKQDEQAVNTLSAISSEFELTSLEQDIHHKYLDYFDILEMMNDSSVNARQLDSLSVQELTSIMNTNLPLISSYARSMLVKGRHINYTETVSFPSTVKSYPSYYYIDTKKIDFPDEDHLVLFPNPSGDYVVAYINSLDYGQTGILEIDDIQGKRLSTVKLNSKENQVVINLSDFPNGVYFVSLMINNKMIESKKFSKGRY